MLPYPLENGLEHWPRQASALGILLTWMVGSQEDFAAGEGIFIAMSKLHPGGRVHSFEEDLKESIEGNLPQGYDDLNFLQEGYFIAKVWTAVLNFLPVWLIFRGSTLDNSREEAIP